MKKRSDLMNVNQADEKFITVINVREIFECEVQTTLQSRFELHMP